MSATSRWCSPACDISGTDSRSSASDCARLHLPSHTASHTCRYPGLRSALGVHDATPIRRAWHMQRRKALATALGGLGWIAAPGLCRAQAAPATPGDIVLGQSAVISGPLGVPIKALNAGAQLAFDAAHAAGGIHGRRVRLVTLDDELAPPKAV